MTEQAVNTVPLGGADEDAPPRGTAIVRPLRHVKAVRERHLAELAERSLGAESRSARAWSWALGETNVAPVTDQVTDAPPGLSDVEAEITVADERRLRGDRENRADGAATVLRWLIGLDDRVPVRGPNRGELVGGFGDIVRSPDQILENLTILMRREHRADGRDRQLGSCFGDIQGQLEEADYVNGIIATLRWVAYRDARAPVSRARVSEKMTGALKSERVHAEDVVEQLGTHGVGDRLQRTFGVGVVSAINWLLGDSTALNCQEPAL